jgi:hypothetical protein
MDELLRLLLNRRDDFRLAMSGILTADAASEIKEAVPVDILDRHTVRAPHKDR